jgi:hypothetical protein
LPDKTGMGCMCRHHKHINVTSVDNAADKSP